jgi:hypothetical protein
MICHEPSQYTQARPGTKHSTTENDWFWLCLCKATPNSVQMAWESTDTGHRDDQTRPLTPDELIQGVQRRGLLPSTGGGVILSTTHSSTTNTNVYAL